MGGTGLGGMAGSAGATSGTNAGGEAGEPSVGAGTPTEDPLKALAKVRQEHSVAAAAGKIYVIGGYEPMGTGNNLVVTASVEAYDPKGDSWSGAADFPVPMNHGNVGTIDDVIYVAGFYINGMSEATTQVFAYDPAMDEWTEKAAMPAGTERAAGCAAVDGGKLYVTGGANMGMSVEDFARYDPDANEWETLPSLPDQREHCVSAAIGGKIYVTGGREDSITNVVQTSYVFDVAGGKWSEIAKLMPPRGGLAGAALGGRFFVFGGEGNPDTTTHVFPDIDAYTPGTNTWEKVGEMDIPRHGLGAAALGDKIYLPGGATMQGGAASNNVSVFYLQ
jgi:N-acetylneuraminic acid mutarotase